MRAVVDAVLALDEPYRSVVLARYFRGWDPNRIARESAIPIATVKSRLQRALSLLREKLDRTHGGRANWALALAPFAGVGRAATIATALKLVAASAVVLAPAYFLWTTRRARTSPLVAAASAARPAQHTADSSTVAPIQGVRPDESRVAQDTTAKASANHVSGTLQDLPYPELGIAGGPAAGVQVFVPYRIPGSKPERYERATATTRDDGSFELEMRNTDPDDDAPSLMTEEDDVWRRVDHPIDLAKGAAAREGLQLTRAAHGILHGVVVDGDEKPVTAATLRVHDSEAVTPPKEVEIVSDDHGAFALPWRIPCLIARAVDPSSTVVNMGDRIRMLDTGGWEPTRIVLASSATLRVRVVGADGGALPKLQVLADLATGECGVLGMEATRGWGVSTLKIGTTDERGEVELGGLWAGRQLVIRVGGQKVGGSTSAELPFETQPGSGEPIVLAPGEVRSVLVRWSGDLRVAGTVVTADGRPMSNVGIEVTDLGSPEAERWQPLGVFNNQKDGRFEARLRSPTLRGPVRFVARQHGKKGRAPLPYELGDPGDLPPTDGAVGERTMELLEAVDGVLHADIVMEPGITITGTLIDARGDLVTRSGNGRNQLWAVESARSSQIPRDARNPGFDLSKEGVFTFYGLSKRDYDIYVSEEIDSNFSWPSFIHRFPGIAAGSQSIELRLPPRKEVHVRMRTHGEGVEGVRVLLGALVPNDPDLRKVAADRSSHITEAVGWPVGANLDFLGAGGGRMEEGNLDCAYYSADEVTEHELPPMGAGWYVFGIIPIRAKSELWSAQSTELRWYEPGEYTIDFDAVPSTTISGRIFADASREYLGVALETLSGRRIPLEVQPGFGQSSFILETDAGGRFVIRHAPTGRFRLLAGNAADLAQGRFRTAVPIEVGASGISGLEIRFQ